VSGSAQLDQRSPEQALGALGIQCTVEGRGNLAVVIPAPGERALENAAVRRAALVALRSFGFTHAAVEPYEERGPAKTPDAPIA
jgi:hypothetical protein